MLKSQKHFWQILATLKDLKFSPFVVGIFCVKQKPKNLDFMNDFVAELSSLVNNGYSVKSGKVHVTSLEKVTSDTPAMAMLKRPKGKLVILDFIR